MPIETRFDAACGVFVHVLAGVPTRTALQEAALARGRHGGAGPGTPVLWDLTGLDAAQVGLGEMRPIFAAVAQRRARGEVAPRIALLAPSDLIYGVARMYASYVASEMPELAVFRTAEEALAWLTPGAASP